MVVSLIYICLCYKVTFCSVVSTRLNQLGLDRLGKTESGTDVNEVVPLEKVQQHDKAVSIVRIAL